MRRWLTKLKHVMKLTKLQNASMTLDEALLDEDLLPVLAHALAPDRAATPRLAFPVVSFEKKL